MATPPRGPEGSGGSPGIPGGVRRETAGVESPSQKAGRGQDFPQLGRGGLGGPPVWPGGFRNPSRKVERRREAHTDGWGVGSPPKGSSREFFTWTGRGHKVLLEGQKESRGPPGGKGRGLGALLENREGLRGQEEVGSLSQRARRAWEAHP